MNSNKYISQVEYELIVGEFNNTENFYPKQKTVVDLFEEQVEKTPQNVAVIFENEKITYFELNKRANQLAQKLRKIGVKPNDFVAIMVERSVEMIIGIYGILKAGGAYLPIDPVYPKNRIEYIMEDSKPKAILIYKTNIKTNIPVIDLADNKIYTGISTNPHKVNKQNDLIYCIYTSGTNGKPKGVMIENQNVVNFSYNSTLGIMKEAFDNGYSKILSVTSISFDIFVTESILPTLNGMTIYIANKNEQETAAEFSKILVKYKIEILQSTPSRIKMLLSDSKNRSGFKKLKLILLGGEKVESSLIKELVKVTDAQMINVYGPTETTVWSSRYLINTKDIPDIIPIGKPISNTQVFIMNEMQQCGIDMIGELCIAGEGVARGYLNNYELTTKKFSDNPFGDGKLYHTGDLAKWLSDGNIEYLGRIDEQVKIRGYRIELGEIENAIMEIDYIKNVAVITGEDTSGNKIINAYIISDKKVNMLEIRNTLSKSLPEYMIPTYIMKINSIPLTPNGKLDKRALPKIEMKSEREYIKPNTPIEEELVSLWEEFLDVERIGINDNFIELGGHSLLANRILLRINQMYQIDISLTEMFTFGRTVVDLSKLIEEKLFESLSDEEKEAMFTNLEYLDIG
jgi:amino acid adenylation domain-containing protein